MYMVGCKQRSTVCCDNNDNSNSNAVVVVVGARSYIMTYSQDAGCSITLCTHLTETAHCKYLQASVDHIIDRQNPQQML